MSEIVVGNLRYRGDPARATLAGSMISDALRTALVDDGRLILVRRMALGRLGHATGNRALAERTEAAWRDLVGRACHGSSSSAASAECVWFRSSAEARAHLLRELAAGRPAFGWFWKLAVPDWHGQPLTGWLRERFAAAIAHSDGAALLETIEASLAAACWAAASEALAAVLPAMGGQHHSPEAAAFASAVDLPVGSTGEPGAAPVLADAAILHMARAAARHLPEPVRQALRAAAARPGGQRLVSDLARAMLRRSHPEVLLDTGMADRAVDMLARVLLDLPLPPPPAIEPAQPARIWASEVDALPALHEQQPPNPIDPAAAASPAALAPPTAPPVAANPAPPPALPPIALPAAELASAHAGLFLAVPVLIRLGWREWLLQRPGLLPLRPGAGLLQHIAHRHRVPRGDPLWTHLGEPVPTDDTALAAVLELWRRGLDGWLRRIAQRRLHDLILRPGWLGGDAEQLVVRFRIAAIDMALRRRALDSDPGWTDWLGRSLRFEFRDRPANARFPA